MRGPGYVLASAEQPDGGNMRRAALFAVFISAAAGAVRSAPAPEAAPTLPAQPAQAGAPRRTLPVEGVITNPDWLAKPTGNDIARYYPRLATVVGVEGRATVHCLVTAAGALADCAVTSEAPKGMRFGEATLKLANVFRMRPMTVDGAPVSGGQINVPVRFQLPTPREPAIDTPGAASPPPSPRAMAMARRVSAVMARNWVASWSVTADQLRTSLAPLSPEEEVALRAYGKSVGDQTPLIIDQYTAIYAKSYSETELAGIATFLESPAGQAWYSRSRISPTVFQAVGFKVQQAASAEALARLCEQTTCAAQPATAPAARAQLPLAK